MRKPTRGPFFRRTKDIEPELGTELKIKGRIFATNITEIVAFSKPGALNFLLIRESLPANRF